MTFFVQLSRKLFIFIFVLGSFFSLQLENVSAGENNIRFAVISDSKTDNYSGLQNALTFIAEQQADFVIVAGDFSPLSEVYSSYYVPAGYFVSGEKEADMQDVYFVMGNHDREPYGDSFFQEYIAPHYPENGPYYAPPGTIYSFDRGKAHIVVTNQYWNYKNGGYTDEQLNWIEQDLKASQQPYKFVIGHEPAYPTDRHVGGSLDAAPEMRDTFWEILSENGVQAFFCGHTHHLSVVDSQGVYQINSARVVSDHLAVVIVDINDTLASARLYETDGSIPEPASHNLFSASLNERDTGDSVDEVVFSSAVKEEDTIMGCFVQSLGLF